MKISFFSYQRSQLYVLGSINSLIEMTMTDLGNDHSTESKTFDSVLFVSKFNFIYQFSLKIKFCILIAIL